MTRQANWILAAMVFLGGIVITVGNEARAIMASPPTCVASQAMCTRCAEYEGPRRPGRPSRCVKC